MNKAFLVASGGAALMACTSAEAQENINAAATVAAQAAEATGSPIIAAISLAATTGVSIWKWVESGKHRKDKTDIVNAVEDAFHAAEPTAVGIVKRELSSAMDRKTKEIVSKIRNRL